MANIVTLGDLAARTTNSGGQRPVVPYRAPQRAPGAAAIPIRRDAAEEREKTKLCKTVALYALKELVVGLILAIPTAFFIATPASMALLFVGLAVTVIFNAAVRGHTRYYEYKLFVAQRQGFRDRDPNEITRLSERHADAQRLENFICPTAFVFSSYLTGPGTLIHEGGHAIASHMVYKNPVPNISVDSGGGKTSFFTNELTSFGNNLGKEGSSMFVSAAGAGIWVLISAGAMFMSHKWRKTHPELSRYLLMTVIISIFHHVVYAISALTASMQDKSHDFVNLWLGGVHPLVSVICMIAIPLLVKGGMILYDRYKARHVH